VDAADNDSDPFGLNADHDECAPARSERVRRSAGAEDLGYSGIARSGPLKLSMKAFGVPARIVSPELNAVLTPAAVPSNLIVGPRLGKYRCSYDV
jgi:hypothetical protein